MNLLPKAKNTNIIQQEIGKELLIYDLQIDTAYNLNETSAIIYHACNGLTSFEEIKQKHKFNDDLIYFALNELNSKNLLENYKTNNFSGLSRREVIRKVGLTSLVALPMVASIVAPNAANAASGGGLLPLQAACGNNAQCASNRCAVRGVCCSGGDGAACTTGDDCCLEGSGCRPNNTCCRGTGRGAGTTLDPQPALCCSGTCNNVSSLCVCT